MFFIFIYRFLSEGSCLSLCDKSHTHPADNNKDSLAKFSHIVCGLFFKFLLETRNPESIEWSIEDQAFFRSFDLAPSRHFLPSRQLVVSFSQSSCVSPVEQTARRRGRGWARSQIIRLRGKLVLCKSVNTLWCNLLKFFCRFEFQYCREGWIFSFSRKFSQKSSTLSWKKQIITGIYMLPRATFFYPLL